jgi:RHS repeat-associated protein
VNAGRTTGSRWTAAGVDCWEAIMRADRYSSKGMLVVLGRMLGVLGGCLAALFFAQSGAAADVDPSGAYTTSVSIDVPSFHGLEPRLGLVYSSPGPNGWMGKGWSLEGLSTIRRQSSEQGLPHWDRTDTFSLDGLDMMSCPINDDGSSVAKSPSCAFRLPGFLGYTTRVETFQRIATNGDPLAEPVGFQSWIVWRTDGVKAIYVPGLRTPAGVLEWRLDKVEDLSGNSVEYVWAPPEGNQVSVLKAIRYSDVEIRFQTERRPDPLSFATGAGTTMINPTRLQAIDITVGGQRIRAYDLRYKDLPGGSAQSFLASVQEFGSDAVVDGDGVHGPTSLPPVTFDSPGFQMSELWRPPPDIRIDNWADNWPAMPDDSNLFSTTSTMPWLAWERAHKVPNGGLIFYNPAEWVTMDFNGDGRLDSVRVLNVGVGFEVEAVITQPAGGFKYTKPVYMVWPAYTLGIGGLFNSFSGFTTWVGDVDGDGFDDLTVMAAGVSGTVFGGDFGSAGGDLLYPPETSHVVPLPAAFPGGKRMGDVTGDGRADLVGIKIPEQGCCVALYVARGDGTGKFDAPVQHSTGWAVPSFDTNYAGSIEFNYNQDIFQLADVNGDLKSDVVGFETASESHNARMYVAISDGFGNFTTFNRDTGKDWREQLEVPSCGPYGVTACDESWGFPPLECDCTRSITTQVRSFWSDANADGRTDLIVLKKGHIGSAEPFEGVESWTAFSLGTGGYSDFVRGDTPFPAESLRMSVVEDRGGASGVSSTSLERAPSRWLAADFNGDGAADLATVEPVDPAGGTVQRVQRAVSDMEGNWITAPDMPETHPILCPAGCHSDAITTAGDVNGDGRDDVVFVFGGGKMSMAVDATPAGASDDAILSGDVNADGRQDLLYPVATPAGTQVRVFQQRADRTYQTIALGPILATPSHLSQRGWLVADVNCDRRTDLVHADTGIVLLAAGDHDWDLVRGFDSEGLGSRPVVADVNGDGCDDLIRFHKTGSLLQTWLGREKFERPDTLLEREFGYIPGASAALVTALKDPLHWTALDVDSDNRADLVHVDGTTGEVRTLLRRGTEHLQHPVGYDQPAHWMEVTSAAREIVGSVASDSPTWRALDVNGDGAGDLARVTVAANGEVGVATLLSNGDGTFSDEWDFPVPGGEVAGGPLAGEADHLWVPADLDRDGRIDLTRVFNNGDLLAVETLFSGPPQGESSSGQVGWALTSTHRFTPRTPATSTWRVGDSDGSGQAGALRLDAPYRINPDGVAQLPPELIVSGYVSTAPSMGITHEANGLGAAVDVTYEPATTMCPFTNSICPSGYPAVTPTPAMCRVPTGVTALPVVTHISTSVTHIATSEEPTRTFDDRSVRYACLRYSGELSRPVAWDETWTTHVAARNRPVSTQHVDREVFASGIVQPVIDEVTGGGVVHGTQSFYEPLGPAPHVDLLERTDDVTCQGPRYPSAGGPYVGPHERCATSTTTFGHDQFGNVDSLGEFASGIHEREPWFAPGRLDLQRRTETDYIHNDRLWLHGLPRLTSVFDTSGLVPFLMRKTLVCYDGAVSVECDQPPTRGLPTLTRVWDRKTDSFVVASEATYDTFGNQDTSTDANGNTTTTTYDGQLHLYPIETCTPKVRLQLSDFPPRSTWIHNCVSTPWPWDRRAEAPLTTTDPNQATTQTHYDPLGRVDTIEQPTGAVVDTDFQTDAATGTITSITTTAPDLSTPLKTISYVDGLGRTYLTKSLADDGERVIETPTEYSDSTDLPWRSASPHFDDEPAVWQYTDYDAAGRPIRLSFADGNSKSWRYDVRGQLTLVETTDETGRTQTGLYDGWGDLRLVEEPSVIDGQTAQTRYAYDAVGQLVTIIDAAGNVLRNQYDSLGRKTLEEDPDRGSTYYLYDAVGNLEQRTDARGRIVRYGYDALNRLIWKKDIATGAISTWVYDQPGHGASIGRLTSVHDPSATGCPDNASRSLTYDPVGNIEQDVRCVLGTTQKFQSHYDALNRLHTLTYPDGETLTYTYHPGGNLRHVSDYTNTMAYNARGQQDTIQYTNGTIGTWHYDTQRGWLASHTVTNGAGRQLFDEKYTPYPNGMIHTAISASNRTNETYTYDAVGRLDTVTGSWQQDLDYDDLGNLAANSRVGVYRYPQERQCVDAQGGQPTCAGPHAVTKAGDTTYEYDAAGNMITVNDPEPRLSVAPRTYVVGTSTGGENITTLWDMAEHTLGDPRRWREIYTLNKGRPYPPEVGGRFQDPDEIYNGQHLILPDRVGGEGVITTRLLTWNSDGLITEIDDTVAGRITNVYDADGNLVQQTTRAGTTNFYGTLAEGPPAGPLTKFIYAGSELVARHTGATRRWYTLDRLGSPRLTTKGNGDVATRRNYSPFGETSMTSGGVQPIGYTGHRGIGETGLINMVARAYDPQLGRMVSADTIIPDMANPQALNRYSYVYNNPIKYTDPTGHADNDTNRDQAELLELSHRSFYEFIRTAELYFEVGSAAFSMGSRLHPERFDPLVSTEDLEKAWMSGKYETPLKAYESFRKKDVSVDSPMQHSSVPSPANQAPPTGGGGFGVRGAMSLVLNLIQGASPASGAGTSPASGAFVHCVSCSFDLSDDLSTAGSGISLTSPDVSFMSIMWPGGPLTMILPAIDSSLSRKNALPAGFFSSETTISQGHPLTDEELAAQNEWTRQFETYGRLATELELADEYARDWRANDPITAWSDWMQQFDFDAPLRPRVIHGPPRPGSVPAKPRTIRIEPPK